MTHRWKLLAAAALVTAAATGCGTAVAGAGTFVAGPSPSSGPSGGGIDTSHPSASALPSASASASPSSVPTASPSAGSTPTPSAGASGDLPNGAICTMVSPADLRQIFGTTPQAKRSTFGAGCTFSGAGVFVIVDEFSTFTVAEQKSENNGRDTTVSGHPAAVLDGGDIVVAEGRSATGEGVLKAYTDTDATSQRIGRALLEKVLPHFATN